MTNYDASSIEVLEGLEPVRTRPGMYIGGTDNKGYHHLLWEIVDNSIDEVINGHADMIWVTLGKDGRSVTVEDNGRGIPVDIHPKYGVSALELILTKLHSGAKFSKKSFQYSGGLHGVGSSVVNALSSELIVSITRDSKVYEQAYSRGTPKTKLTVTKEGVKGHGTKLFFRPDREIFGDKLQFDSELIKKRLEAKTFLHSGLQIFFEDKLNGGEKYEYVHVGGIQEFLGHVLAETSRKELPGRYYGSRPSNPRLEVALCWTEDTNEQIFSFVNSIPTGDGGTHELGLKSAIVKAIRNFGNGSGLFPKGLQITAEDIREGLVAIISTFVSEPQFQGQTKDRLNNPEVQAEVENAVRQSLESWLIVNQTTSTNIINRIVLAAKAREASRAASLVTRKTVVQRSNLPGKLADCSSNDPMECELFIVEGDSAGGSAKQGRDRKFQAILPLRGKVLNTEQATNSKVTHNKELQDIVSALGCGMGPNLDLSRLRYHKIFLLMDADSDGNHIAVLLLTFFYRHMRQLVENGHIYLAQPPLYKVTAGKETYWALDDIHKDKLLHKLKSKVVELQRFKGLGEMMPQTLKETTLDPSKRKALRVDIEDDTRTDRVLNELMGKDPSMRFHFVMQNAQFAKDMDI